MTKKTSASPKWFNSDFSATVCVATACVTRTWSGAVALTLAVMLMGTDRLFADDTEPLSQVDTIYNLSGVHSHLSWISSVVAQESAGAAQNCADKESIPNISNQLSQILSIDALQTSFLQELSDRTTEAQRSAIVLWANSASGQQIYQAEVDSVDSDEEQFNRLYKEYQASDIDFDERNKRISAMLTDTGAVYFISAINSEISALVSLASVCSATPEELAKAEREIKKERGEEALYRAFMRQELIIPATVVYKDVSDEAIDAYSEFANSDAGNAYFTALIKGIRAVLSSKVDEIKLALESS